MDNTWYMEGAQEYQNEHDMMGAGKCGVGA